MFVTFLKHFLWMLSKLCVFSKVNCKSADLCLHSLVWDISLRGTWMFFGHRRMFVHNGQVAARSLSRSHEWDTTEKKLNYSVFTLDFYIWCYPFHMLKWNVWCVQWLILSSLFHIQKSECWILLFSRLYNVSTSSCAHLTVILSSCSSCLCHFSLLPLIPFLPSVL